MKIVAIHSKKTGSTHAISQMLLEEIRRLRPDAEVSEFSVAGFKPCVGCFSCFAKGEETCPHYDSVHPLITAMEESDVVVLDSPTYCMGMSGAMRSFTEHLGYRWFAHRPHPAMAGKIGVAISTTGSMGAGGVTKALKAQFFGLGMAKYFRLGFAVMGFDWKDINPKKKARIRRVVRRTARKIAAKSGKAKRGVYLRLILWAMRFVQQRNTWFPLDRQWWQDQGWIK
ncbi:MAG: NAD(P)H-dependent oxidoreductase [Lachnospiraceae bacterium]|jgi:multimeric flavodoxin WrbA|nr:NAD(P)H-dependent oxidoreductase [Lachnospiraceae bacterium]